MFAPAEAVDRALTPTARPHSPQVHRLEDGLVRGVGGPGACETNGAAAGSRREGVSSRFLPAAGGRPTAARR